MKALLHFELGNYFKKIGFHGLLLFVLLFGAFIGANLRLSISPDIFKNSPYTVAYMTGFLSLFCIFFAVIFTTQILFREKDSNFNLILFSTPMRKKDYLLSRFLAVFSITFICFALLILGFAVGQNLFSGNSNNTGFHILFYLQPLILFGLLNSFFCSALLCSFGWLTKNKLMVYVTGLFIYIAYMVLLIFSGSPIMAKGMPQSAEVVRLSAMLDPFGLSGYFLQTSNWSVTQRNTELIPLSGVFLCNRIGVVLVSLVSLLVAFKKFSFSTSDKGKNKKSKALNSEKHTSAVFKTIQLSKHSSRHWATLFSFTKLDIKYIIKSIPFVLICIGLLFCLSMEMFGSIEKGIRLPLKYASSGLMAKTIIDNFHGFCLIVILFYGNEITWRSKNSNFYLIENATPAGKASWFFSKWLTLTIIILILSTLMIFLGIGFQLAYDYPSINWPAYGGVYLFNSFQLMVSAGIIIIVQKIVNHKYLGLAVTCVLLFFSATTLSKNLISHPLLTFQIPYSGYYSDLNGYGLYVASYAWQIIFGLNVVLLAGLFLLKFKNLKLKTLPYFLGLLALGYFSSYKITAGYEPKDENIALAKMADYEKEYRKFQNLPQPTITDVSTNIDLYPEENRYNVKGKYIFENKTDKPITALLIGFSDNIKISKGNLIVGNESFVLKKENTIITLKKPLLPKSKGQLDFEFSYSWSAVNGHESFNAIVGNGSFMRISRYYPQFGYALDNEIVDENIRKQFDLEKATELTKIEAPKTSIDDFINLKTIISTNSEQIAIGVGDLQKQWKDNNRNYFYYETPSPIPFRFAVSSAKYAVKTASQNGKKIEIYYHPSHHENVDHLLKNIQLTMQYCEANFGIYPYKTIRFAEVSGFTKGFAATAYPATIYMTEDMVFHADIKDSKEQDVINELAGHELSHIWWGNNQISPDDREGSAMLTETLAMYTELMLVKKRHGKKGVLENIKLHNRMYLDERGYSDERPLYKVLGDDTHLSYSKGVIAMYQLSELIGEETVNLALKNFLKHHGYPNQKPVSTDFLNELYSITSVEIHPKIDDLFKRITFYDFNITNEIVKNTGQNYELSFEVDASKYYEDGKGNKTTTAFNDGLEIAIRYGNGSQKIIKLPAFKNKTSYKIALDKKPIEVEIDPYLKFIKPDSEKNLLKL